MTSRSKLNRIKGEERKFLLQNLLSRANWYFWISNFSVLTTVNSSWLKVNLVHLISLKFCSIWPEKELSSSLERCESDEMFVAVSMLQDLGALASSEPFSCTRSLIRVRPQILSFPLSCQGCTRGGTSVRGQRAWDTASKPWAHCAPFLLLNEVDGNTPYTWRPTSMVWSACSMMSQSSEQDGWVQPACCRHGACKVLVPKPYRDTIWILSAGPNHKHGRVNSSSPMAEVIAFPGAILLAGANVLLGYQAVQTVVGYTHPSFSVLPWEWIKIKANHFCGKPYLRKTNFPKVTRSISVHHL